MDQVTLSVKKAAWYEAGAWSVEVKEGADSIWLYWKNQPVSLIREGLDDGLAIDVAQELSVVLSAALNALRQEKP